MCRVTLEPEDGRVSPRTVEDVHTEFRQGEPWAQALYEHRPVVFDLSRPRLVGVAAIGVCFAGLGAFMVVFAGADTVMWLGGMFMGILGLVFVARAVRLLTRSAAALQVDTFGVRLRPASGEHPWRDIVATTSWRHSHNHFVGLLLTDSARAERFAHRSTTYRRVRRVLTWPHGVPQPGPAQPSRGRPRSGGQPAVRAAVRAISTIVPNVCSRSCAEVSAPVTMWSDTVQIASARRPCLAASVYSADASISTASTP
jgi:hypothetical protein